MSLMRTILGGHVTPLLLLSLLACTAAYNVHRTPLQTSSSMSRRSAAATAGAAAGALFSPLAAPAIDVSGLPRAGGGVDLNGIKLEEGPNRDPAVAGRQVFVGEWADPNHPNGGRSITLSNSKLLGFQLAVVELYNEVGEAPKSLNALVGPVAGKQTITVDFTPVGGPAEFRGQYYAATGGLFASDRIEFPDGNAWTKKSPATATPPN